MNADERLTARSSEDCRERSGWMAILARATTADLEGLVAKRGGVPEHTVLKPAEVGTIMVEGRAGGSGVRFNAGEATVTRCIVRISGGAIGYSMALGTDRRKALLAAIVDALLQEAGNRSQLATEIEALAVQQAAARDLTSRKAARTKVEFFTLVRGSD